MHIFVRSLIKLCLWWAISLLLMFGHRQLALQSQHQKKTSNAFLIANLRDTATEVAKNLCICWFFARKKFLGCVINTCITSSFDRIFVISVIMMKMAKELAMTDKKIVCATKINIIIKYRICKAICHMPWHMMQCAFASLFVKRNHFAICANFRAYFNGDILLLVRYNENRISIMLIYILCAILRLHTFHRRKYQRYQRHIEI